MIILSPAIPLVPVVHKTKARDFYFMVGQKSAIIIIINNSILAEFLSFVVV